MDLYKYINKTKNNIKKKHGKNFIPYVISGILLWIFGFIFLWVCIDMLHMRIWVFYLLFTPFGWLIRYSIYYMTGFAQRHE